MCQGSAKFLNSATIDYMQMTNNMPNYQFTIAPMCMLVAYSIFEIPTNLVLKDFTPHMYVPSG